MPQPSLVPLPYISESDGIYYGVKKAFPVIAVTIFMVLIAVKPDYFSASAARGLALFATSVLPSVFPFFFCSTFLTAMGAAKALSRIGAKPVRALFNAPPEGAYALTMSMLSGYPVGAAVTADLYERAAIDDDSARKIASFASTSGPAFVLGTVGGVLFDSAAVGALLLGAHFLSALLVGVIFRGRKNTGNGRATKKTDKFPKRIGNRRARGKDNFPNHLSDTNVKTETASTDNPSAAAQSEKRAAVFALDTDNALSDSIHSSTLAMLAVGGYVVLGNMLVDALALTGLESAVYSLLPREAAQALLAFAFGAIEMTRGCLTASDVSYLPVAAATTAACISFGGLSVMLQSHAFLSRCKIKIPSILLRKSVQAILAFAITYLIFLPFRQIPT